MNPTKEQMHQWYAVEKKSYRQIMAITGIKSNRKIPKLLNEYGIEIRRGSEAVKTQWINNDARRKNQGELLSKTLKGEPSKRRLENDEIESRLNILGVSLNRRTFSNGYTLLECECQKCSCEYTLTLRNIYGCPDCGRLKGWEANKIPFKEVEKMFNEQGFIMLDTEYKDSATPLAVLCVNHSVEGIQYKSLNGIKKSGNCKFCNMEERHNNKGATDRQLYQYHLKRWRVAVFERDGYTCQCCGDKRGGNLNAHHIENFSSNQEGRLDVNNGITLCEPCHNPVLKGSFHHVYGTRNNNKEQLENYICSKKVSIL